MFNFLIFINISNIISCCTSQKNKDNEQIKKVAIRYFDAIKRGDTVTYKSLYKLNDGGDIFEFNFLKRNYSKINPHNTLFKNIKVKDTVNIGVRPKYIMFTLKKPNYKPFETNQDLKMYLMFWKNTGYNKVDQIFIIGNMAEWEDVKPLKGY